MAALYWHVTRRRVRARHRLRQASSNHPSSYKFWIAFNERQAELAPEQPALIERWAWRPTFAILLYVSKGAKAAADDIERARASVEGQTYRQFRFVDCSETSLARGFDAADADYAMPLRAGNALSRSALFRLAESLQANPAATVLYGDQDRLDDRGRRRDPWFKPGWNLEMFLAQDYLSDCAAIRSDVAKMAAVDAASDLDALLLEAISRADGCVVHVPHILVHSASPARRPPTDRTEFVARHLAPSGATCTRGPFGTVEVHWPLPAKPPLATIIVPTRDKVKLLRACLDSVLSLTRYPAFEIIVVDNGSADPETLEYFAELAANPAVRVLSNDEPYNFSALNNFAARHANGQYLCLLNNDTEVIAADWLGAMMRYAVRPDVGAVGAKLLYADGAIQHAGVVVGMGEAAGHAHRFTPNDQPGYFCQPHVAQFVSAVTAACLVVDKAKFESVGGLDDENLAIAYNDVDLCLKLQARGWRNVYVPRAVLFHHESKSRGSDFSAEHVDRYRRELTVLQERWSTRDYADPLHNPNLDRHSETFVLRI